MRRSDVMSLDKIKKKKYRIEGKKVIKTLRREPKHGIKVVPIKYSKIDDAMLPSAEEWEKLYGEPKPTHKEVDAYDLMNQEERTKAREKDYVTLPIIYEDLRKDFEEHTGKFKLTDAERKEIVAMNKKDNVALKAALSQSYQHEKMLDIATKDVKKLSEKRRNITAAWKQQQEAKIELERLGYKGNPLDILTDFKWKSFERLQEIDKANIGKVSKEIAETLQWETKPEQLPEIAKGKALVVGDVSALSKEEKKQYAKFLKSSGMYVKEIAVLFGKKERTIRDWTEGVKRGIKGYDYVRTTKDILVKTGYKKTGYREGDFTPVGKTKRVPIEGESKYKPGPGRPLGSPDKKPRKKTTGKRGRVVY